MKSDQAPPPDDLGEQIAALVRTLHETEQRLQELTQGQLDTVMLPTGQNYLLSKAQEKLRQSEEQFRHLADNITDVFWIRSPDMSQVHYVSPAFERIWGRPVESLLTNPQQWIEFVLPEDRDRVRAAFAGLVGAVPNVDIEYRITRPDGEIRWVQARGFKVRDAAGKVICLTGIVTDITKRKQVEEALQESEERFSGAFEHAPIGVALVAPDGRWLKVNRAICDLVGYTEAELLTRTFQDITYPGDLNGDLENMRQMLAGEIHSYQMEKRYIHQRGHLITVLLCVSLVRDGQGQPRYFISQIQDISERKQAEEALRHNEQEQRQLARQLEAERARLLDAQAVAKVGSWETDLATLAVTWSAETYRIFETSPDKFQPSHPGFLELVHPDDRAAVDGAFVRSMSQRGLFAVEHRLLMPDGRIKFLEERWQVLKDGQGRPARAAGTCQDITERKKNEARIRRLVDSNAQGVIFWNTKGEINEANDAFLKIVGYTRADLEAGLMGWAAMTPPEYAHLDQHGLKEIAAKGVCTPFEKEYIRKDGSRVPILIGAAMFEDNPQEGVCFVLDLTERMKSERELSRINRALQMLSSGNERLIRAESEQELLDEICQVAVEIGGYRMAWVGYALGDEYKTIKPMAHAGEKAGYLSEINFSWSENEPSGREPAGQTIRSGKVVVAEDIGDKSNFSTWHTAALAHGYRGVICLPLREGDLTFGLLTLYSNDVLKVDAGEIKLLQELADDLAFGIGNLRARNERQRADTRVREQAALLDAASDAIILNDMDDRILFWNRGAEQIYGWTAVEALGRKSREFLFTNPAGFDGAQQVLLQKGHWHGEIPQHTKDGRLLTVEARWTLVRDQNEQPKSILAIYTDITERKRLESQFLRVQRMESIGTLAGGVAHDLNNMLAPITMSIHLLQEKVSDEEGRALLGTLQASAQRGAELVNQVLAFARGVEGQRTLINPAHLIREIQKIVRETFPKSIEFRFDPGRDSWMVTGDPTQLHQVFMNLCVNARDAMPNGGKLSISIENSVLDEAYAGMNPGSKQGAFVLIKIADTGTGIPQEIREKIFEPFFTTKDIGKGTGLGLSTTQAIVKSHDGFINVCSEPGKGSVFNVYLPAQTTAKATEKVASEKTLLPRGRGELVLVVDDEDGIRIAARKTLERFGYRVLLANNGAEAVSLYARHGDEIAVVLTDMAMPVMDGPSTIIALKVMNPKVKVIGTSGHTSNEGVAKAVGAGVEYFIPKPYTAEMMLKTFAQALK